MPAYHRIDFSFSKRLLVSKGLKTDIKIAIRNFARNRNILERIHFYDVNTGTIQKIDRYAMVPFVNVGLRVHYD